MDLTYYQHLSVIESLAEAAGGRFRYLNNRRPAYRMKEGEWVKLDASPDAFAVEKNIGIKIEDLQQVSDKVGAIAKIKDHRWLYRVFESIENDNAIDTPLQAMQAFKDKLKQDGAIVRGPEVQRTVEKVFSRRTHTQEKMAVLSLSGIQIMRRSHHARPDVNMFPDEVCRDTESSIKALNQNGIKGIIDAVHDVAKLHAMRPDALAIGVHHIFYRASLAVNVKGGGANYDPSYFPTQSFQLFEVARRHYVNNSDGGIKAFDRVVNELDINIAPLGINLYRGSPQASIDKMKALLSRSNKNIDSVVANENQAKLSEKSALAESVMLRGRLDDWGEVIHIMYKGEHLSKAMDAMDSLKGQMLPLGHSEDRKVMQDLNRKAGGLFGDDWDSFISQKKKDQALRIKEALGDGVKIDDALKLLHRESPKAKENPRGANEWLLSIERYFCKERLSAWRQRADKKEGMIVPAQSVRERVARRF